MPNTNLYALWIKRKKKRQDSWIINALKSLSRSKFGGRPTTNHGSKKKYNRKKDKVITDDY